MAVYLDIPDARLAVNAPTRSVDALALRDNPLAIASGDASAAAHRIQTAAIADGAVTPDKLQYPWLNRVFTGAAAAGAIVLDNTMDWRDRYITCQGVAAWFDTLGNAQKFALGGTQDHTIYSNYYYDLGGGAEEENHGTPTNQTGLIIIKSSYMYSRAGVATKASTPRITATVQVTGAPNAEFTIWVSSADGSLNLFMENGGGSADNVAHHLFFGAGVDRGYY